jgi:hypothetical protein
MEFQIMPIIVVEGKEVEVDEGFMRLTPEQQNATVDEIASSINSSGTQSGLQDYEKMSASENFVGQGMLMGFGDELTAAIGTPGRMVKQYMNDQPISMSKAYEEGHDFEQERIRQYKEESPIASTASEIGGSMFGAGNLMKGGVSLLAKNPTVLKAAAEGGIYGGIYGAGTADRGERTEGAARGAATGIAIGTVAQGAGNMIAKKIAANKAAKASIPVDALREQTNAFYKQSEALGLKVSQKSMKHLAGNLKIAAGKTNDKLRPRISGIVDDLDDLASGPMSLEDLDEFRQIVGDEYRRATKSEKRILQRMKGMIDSFSDNLSAKDVTGDLKAIQFLKQGRELHTRTRKVEILEDLMDLADVKAQGQLTQSGQANALRQKFSQLYTQIQKKKINTFSPEEVEIIREMASGNFTPKSVAWLKRLAPKGPVSIAAGQFIGSFFGPAGQIGVPLLGHASAEIADNAAQMSAQKLRDAIASGASQSSPVASTLPRRIIPPAATQATDLVNQSANSNRNQQQYPQRAYRQRP